MPEIKKPKKRSTYKKHSENNKAYNSSWNKLRNSYIMSHPLCEMCLVEGITKEAEEVHHKIPISTTDDPLEKMELLLDSNNLMSLCKAHHHKIHNNLRKK